MKLEHIELENLKPCSVNVRKHGGYDVSDLLPSIRSIGVIQPLLVRPNCEGFEVVAGQRRLKACETLKGEGFEIEALPCAILADGDDALAIEASLAENVARLPMDEIDQYEAFAALKKNGKTVEDIANDCGVTELLVEKRLAIAGLLKPILKAYRNDKIDIPTLRILTLATKKQQKEWLALFRDPKSRAPAGHALRAWLFGGDDIPVSNALFPLENCKIAIKPDLFSDEQYFTDSVKFWERQNQAIAERCEDYRKEGWSDVIVLEVGERFSPYIMAARSMDEGGKVYVSSRHNGEVEFHEGYMEEKEAKRRELALSKLDGSYEPAIRPELTKAAQTYHHLHRHAAVRMELLKQPALALRLMVAHALCGSSLWKVDSDPQNTGKNEAIETSLEKAKAQKAFGREYKAICKLLKIDEEKSDRLCGRKTWRGEPKLDIQATFASLCELTDKQVMRVLSFTMAETLSCGTALIDDLGARMDVDMRNWWKPDNAFFGLLRDKPMLNAMLAEIGGKNVAAQNVTATAKIQKNEIRNFVEGKGARKKVEGWLPRTMAFPVSSYTGRI